MSTEDKDFFEKDNKAEPEVLRVANALFSYLLNEERHFHTVGLADLDKEYEKSKEAFFALSDELYAKLGKGYLDMQGAAVTSRVTTEQQKRMRKVCVKFASELQHLYARFALLQYGEEEYQDEQRYKPSVN